MRADQELLQMLADTRCCYDKDFLLWTREQARVLREAALAGVNIPVG